MEREAYERIFSKFPITNFMWAAAWYWGKKENTSESCKRKVREIINYVVKNDITITERDLFMDPICDEKTITKVIKKLATERDYYIPYVMKNPNFNKTHAVYIMSTWERKRPEVFTEDKFWVECHHIITCKHLPEEKIREFAKSERIGIRASVAANESCPADLLEKLSNDPSFSVRRNVAKNVNTPEHVLLKLVDDKNPQVRKEVAGNCSKSETVIRKLALYEDEFKVITSILKSQICPTDILETFASYVHKSDPERTFVIKTLVAIHPNLSEAGWKILHNDPNPSWSNLALVSKLCPVSIVKTFNPNAKFASDAAGFIMLRNDLTDDVVESFLNNMGACIRAIVIQKRNLPPKVLIKYKDDKSKIVKDALSDKIKVYRRLLSAFEDANPYKNLESEAQSNLIFSFFGAGSADMFIQFINDQHDSNSMESDILQYLTSSNCSNEDLWKVYDEYFKEGSYLNDRMMEAISKRNNLQDETLEMYVKHAYSDFGPYGTKYIMEYLLNSEAFYSTTLLDMCVEYINQEKAKKG